MGKQKELLQFKSVGERLRAIKPQVRKVAVEMVVKITPAGEKTYTVPVMSESGVRSDMVEEYLRAFVVDNRRLSRQLTGILDLPENLSDEQLSLPVQETTSVSDDWEVDSEEWAEEPRTVDVSTVDGESDNLVVVDEEHSRASA